MQLYGIIGDPVSHSLSPIFQPWFAEYCATKKTRTIQNIVYAPFHVRSERVQYAINALWEMGACGLNVTVPHKEILFAFVQADADARIIGAVNTLRRIDNGWQACNTDWRGMADVLIEAKTALLFGAGGTARATLHALHACKYQQVIIANRSFTRAKALLVSAEQNYPNMQLRIINWQQDSIWEAALHADILLNTTVIGLRKDDVFPFRLPESCKGIDAVYRPDGRTAFVQAICHANGMAQDGLAMLVAQGAYSFAYWHGVLPTKHARQEIQTRLELLLHRNIADAT